MYSRPSCVQPLADFLNEKGIHSSKLKNALKDYVEHIGIEANGSDDDYEVLLYKMSVSDFIEVLNDD
jgi:hypothetical protein